MDVSGAMALLNFIEQSDKSGLSVTLEQVPVHIKKTLVAMASNEQKDKLLFVKRKLYEETPLYKGVFVVLTSVYQDVIRLLTYIHLSSIVTF